MRNCMIWCVVLLGIAATARSSGPWPAEQEKATQQEAAAPAAAAPAARREPLSTRNLAGLPGIEELRRFCQSLATLDAIICPESTDRFHSFDCRWGTKMMVASWSNGSGDHYYLLFCEQGAIMKGFSHESYMWNYHPGIWEGVLSEVPAGFGYFLNEPRFEMEYTSFCVWRVNQDSKWHTGRITFPDKGLLRMQRYTEYDPDGSQDLMTLFDRDPKSYKAHVDYIYSDSLPANGFDLKTITAIYAYQPLTEELVAALNPKRTLKDLKEDLVDIGYPVSQETASGKALADEIEAIRRKPEDGDAYRKQGVSHAQRGEHDEAIRNFTVAIRLNPRDGGLYCKRGAIYAELGEHDKAIGNFTEAIRLNPQDGVAYRGRGSSYAAQGEPDKAVAEFTAAIRLGDNGAGVLVSRGGAYSAKKDYHKALADFLEAVRLDPKNPEASNALAWLRATCPEAKLRDGKEALEHAQAACQLTDWKDSYYVDTLAAAYAELGKFDEAVKWEKKALESPAWPPEDLENARSRLQLYEQKKPFQED